MSLINEALKKAQGHQQAQNPNQPPAPPGNTPPGEPHPSHPAPGKRRRSFLWGFLIAVLVVSTISILLTTYFVKQILVEDGKAPAKEAVAVEENGVDSSAVPEEAAPPETEDPALDTQVPGTTPGDPIAETQATGGNSVKDPTTTAAADPATPKEASTPPLPPQPPNPVVISRLMELEIRGVLGGSKVLILDQASGKTRAYRVGDTLEGSMGLMVEDINSSSIKLKDYAGFIHTKSF